MFLRQLGEKYFWGDVTPGKTEKNTRYILNTVMAALEFYRGVSHRFAQIGFQNSLFWPSFRLYLATERQKMGLVRMQAVQELLSEVQHPLPKVLHSLLERIHLELPPTPEGPTLTPGANTPGAPTHSDQHVSWVREHPYPRSSGDPMRSSPRNPGSCIFFTR